MSLLNFSNSQYNNRTADIVLMRLSCCGFLLFDYYPNVTNDNTEHEKFQPTRIHL